jgi:hypothetical protein
VHSDELALSRNHFVAKAYIAARDRLQQTCRVKPLLCAIALWAIALGLDGCAGTRHPNEKQSSADGSVASAEFDAESNVDFDGPPSLIGTGSDVGVRKLTIMPSMPVVTLTAGQPVPTVQFRAYVGMTAAAVNWSIDRGELGAIDKSGVFTPAGSVAGTGNIIASGSTQIASTTITVKLQTTQLGDPAWSSQLPPPGSGGYGGVGGDGPGPPPSPAQVNVFGGAPTVDATVSLLYPYEGTVWPLGLLAPLVQWNPGTHGFDSVRVHIQENNYEYTGYFAANAKPFKNLPIPQQAWEQLTLSNGGEPVAVSLTFAQAGNVFGPYSETWRIAHAALQGNIYYNSYGTFLVKNSSDVDDYKKQYGAATLAIAPGASSPTLVAGINSVNPTGDGSGCRVCHTVSANGKTLVTQASTASANSYSNTVIVNLANDTTGGAGTSLQTNNLAFPALFKDGSLLFSSAGGMVSGDSVSQLYSLPAGTPVANVTGVPLGLQAALPAFSPDGRHVSFNFWAGSFGSTQGDRTSLAIMDFDGNKAFSNPRVLYTPTPLGSGGQPSVAFSSFLPSSAGIVFDLELQNASGNWAFTWKQNTSELWWVDIGSGVAHRLDRLNGYDPSGKLYLPQNETNGVNGAHTAAEDATLNYEPTVCPIVAGGYAWVVFTSRRMYGNVAQIGPWESDPRHYPWQDLVTDKKLWVAAIDLNSMPGTDPSHPAFYLPAQELHAGNSRGFWAFESCRPEGQGCASGAQCCGGYCQHGDGGLTCTSHTPKCSAENDKCTQDSDCCGVLQGIACINDVCSRSRPL